MLFREATFIFWYVIGRYSSFPLPFVLFVCWLMQECGTPGMELLSDALREQRVSFMDQLDLIFKWISLRLCEKENVKAMGQVTPVSAIAVNVATPLSLQDLQAATWLVHVSLSD